MRKILLASLACATALALPAAAHAEDPPLVNWSNLLPGLSSGYEPSDANDCRAGRIQCVDAVIREMTRRFDRLAEDCDHDAIFALSYLRTTEEYRLAATTPGFFEDPGFVNHEDAVFARYYLDAYDAWERGDSAEVPPAWRTALRAADDRTVSATGNMLLGINAHIQNDLPFVLAEIGLVARDGSSRKDDHDRVNEFLNKVSDDLIPEIARRFDPTVDDSDLPTWIDDLAKFQAVPAWRETAWRNAERLVAADSAQERARVAREIEGYAASQALLIRSATAYGLFEDSGERDAFCARNGQG
ncbi:MAG: DUF5995 family protein [Solirubrobacteraceae bacterium MAG38_C4-C5]|nr:DUF5995 family protein [Candidatus Siliceabacter maunaloa]